MSHVRAPLSPPLMLLRDAHVSLPTPIRQFLVLNLKVFSLVLGSSCPYPGPQQNTRDLQVEWLGGVLLRVGDFRPCDCS